MAKFLGSSLLSFVNIGSHSRTQDDDVIDQLNHWATAGLMLTLAAATLVKQFVGQPINCWLPAQYRKSMYQKYANSYCWLGNMYYLPFSEPIPFEEMDRWDIDISFYRWVTIMFLVQALLYKLPNLLWHELKGYSGLNVTKIVELAHSTSLMTPVERERKMANAAAFMHRWLHTYSSYKFNAIARFREKFSAILFCFAKRTGNYLTGLYMFVKVLYIANSIGQFFMLSSFLGLNYWMLGFDAMSTFFKTGKWQDHYTFPRVGLCDYKIRQMANVQTFSVQCVLSVNLFLEKMYLLMWFWMVGVLAANVANFVLWIVDNVVLDRNERFLFDYARMMGLQSKHDMTIYRLFAFSHLKRDGVFILRMVARNTSSLLCMDLVKALYVCFIDDLNIRDRKNIDSITPTSLLRQPSAPNVDSMDTDNDEDEVMDPMVKDVLS